MKFLETLKNIWKISELKDRIILTMCMLLVYINTYKRAEMQDIILEDIWAVSGGDSITV